MAEFCLGALDCCLADLDFFFFECMNVFGWVFRYLVFILLNWRLFINARFLLINYQLLNKSLSYQYLIVSED